MESRAKLDPFWAILAVTAGGLWLLLTFRPISDTDIFWQVRLGQLMWERGEILTIEPFSAPHLGERLTPLAWLCQVIYGQVHSVGGWWLVQRVDAAIWLSGFVVVGISLRKQASAGAIAAGITLGVFTALAFANPRPQSFALLGFGVLIAIVRNEWPGWKKVAVALPILVLWQNLHPSVTVAVMGLGGVFALQLGAFVMRREPNFPWVLPALMGGAIFASVLTPAGFDVYRVSAINAELCRSLGVSEWMPITHPVNFTSTQGVWLLLGVTVIVGFWKRERMSWREVAFALPYFILLLLMYRFVVFWAVAMVPVWARLLSATPTMQRGSRAFTGLFVGAVAVTVIGVSLLANPPLFSEELPRAGLQRLREAGVRGVIVNYPSWGGPLIEAGFPDWTVTYDGRYYVYTVAEWERWYAAIGEGMTVEELVNRHHPAAFVLHPEVERGLVRKLESHPDWRELHRDATVVIFVPNR